MTDADYDDSTNAPHSAQDYRYVTHGYGYIKNFDERYKGYIFMVSCEIRLTWRHTKVKRIKKRFEDNVQDFYSQTLSVHLVLEKT